MSKYKIKDLAIEISQRIDDPKTSGYDKFVGLEHYDSGEVIITRYGKTNNLDSSVKVFQAGDILIARRNVYLKRAGLVNFNGVTSGDSIVLRAKNDSIKKLLPFIFNTKEFWAYANQFADGTMSKRLSPSLLMDFEIELPNDENDRNKLSELLWSIFNTIMSYKRLFSLSDDLIKAEYIKMFNNSDYKKIKIGEVLDYEQPTKYIVNSTQYNDKYDIPVLTAGKSFILGYTNEKENVYKGSNEPTIIFDDFTTDIRYVDFDFKVKSSAMKLIHKRKKEDSILYYYYALLNLQYVPTNHQRHWISIISEKEIFDAPHEKQIEFEKFVLSVEKSKNSIKETMEKLTALYNKIMEKYFNKEE